MSQAAQASAYPTVPVMWGHLDLNTRKFTSTRQVATKPRDEVAGKKWVPLYMSAQCCTAAPANDPIAA